MYFSMVQSCRSPIRAAASTTVLGCALLSGACAPIFSELQSAKLAGRGRLEITPGYSSTHFADEGESEKVQDHYGLQIATGLTSRIDARFRFEHVRLEDEGFSVLGVGPKIAVTDDQLAVFIPLGLAFGDDIDVGETVQIHPTLIGTATLTSYAEVSLSAKALIPLDRDNDDTVAFNLGLGLGDLERWVIRPETGVLLNPGESGMLWHLSLGFTGYVRGSQRGANRIVPVPVR